MSKADFNLLWRKICFIGALALVALAAYRVGVESVDGFYYADEANYCYYAGFFKSYVGHHFDNVVLRSELRYQAVPVGLYWIAATIYFSKYNYMLQEPSKVWLALPNLPDKRSPMNNFILQHPFPYIKKMIYVLRERMLIYRALTCVLIFIIAWYLGGYRGAGLTVALLLFNPSFVEETGLVLIESIWLFQHFLNIIIIYYYFKYRSEHKPNLFYSSILAGLIGVTAGLLIATKINGFLNLFVFLMSYIVIWMKSDQQDRVDLRSSKVAFLHIFIVFFLAAAVFYFMDPALYGHPIAGAKEIIMQRLKLTEMQVNNDPSSLLTDPWRRLMYINKAKINLIDCFFVLIGIGWAIKRFISAGNKQWGYLYTIVLISFFIFLTSILVFMKMGQKRYLLVLDCYLFIFESLGFWLILGNLFKRLRASCSLRN